MFEQFGIINPWIYIAGAFMIVIAPGPNSLYVLKTSVLDGRRAGCAGLLAVLIGDAVLIFLAYLGVAAMIKSHPLAFSMVKIGGGIYLAWIGAKVIWNTFFVKRAKPAGTAAELSVSEQTKPTKGTALRSACHLPIPSRFFFTFPFSFNSSTAHMLIRGFHTLFSR